LQFTIAERSEAYLAVFFLMNVLQHHHLGAKRPEMLKKYSPIFARLFISFDIILIILSFLLAFNLRYKFPLLNWGNLWSVFRSNFLLIALYIFIWNLLAVKKDLYQSKRTAPLSNEFLDILQVTTVSGVIIVSLILFFWPALLDSFFILLFWFINNSLLSLSRLAIRSALRNIRKKGYNYRNVIIVGTNKRSLRLARKIAENPEFGIHLLGFVDDHKPIPHNSGEENINLIGQLDDFQNILTNQVVDEVFITLPIKSYYAKIARVVGICEEAGVEAKLLSSLFTLKVAKDTISLLDDIPLIHFSTAPTGRVELFLKRLIDITISGILLILLSPIFLIVGILIKSTTSGPVFFKQERVGYHQRKFKLYKFRSMYANAEQLKSQLFHMSEVTGPVFKIKNDPRVTKVGKFLRKFSIDELPQLFNVLKGEMSLVGPRPPIQEEVDKYNWWQRRRLSVRPGMTCLWQVSGRSHTSFDKWMDLDLEYIDNWSLKLDFLILLKTVPAVLKAKGAY